MNICIIGIGRLGAGLLRYSKEQGHNVLTVQEESDWLSINGQVSFPKIDIFIVSVDPLRVRGSLSDIFSQIESRRNRNSYTLISFDIKHVGEATPANVYRFSTSPSIGKDPDFSQFLVSCARGVELPSKLISWTGGTNLTTVPSDDFSDWEIGYAACGVISKLLAKLQSTPQFNAPTESHIMALKESINLLLDHREDLELAYASTATPNGIVESGSNLFIAHER